LAILDPLALSQGLAKDEKNRLIQSRGSPSISFLLAVSMVCCEMIYREGLQKGIVQVHSKSVFISACMLTKNSTI